MAQRKDDKIVIRDDEMAPGLPAHRVDEIAVFAVTVNRVADKVGMDPDKFKALMHRTHQSARLQVAHEQRFS